MRRLQSSGEQSYFDGATAHKNINHEAECILRNPPFLAGIGDIPRSVGCSELMASANLSITVSFHGGPALDHPFKNYWDDPRPRQVVDCGEF
jgi:hypothetical protein